ncbi:MAG: 7-cyano-7-deazaguanine synthase QueC [Thermofilum sp.]
MERPSALVLHSGGLDSTTLLYYVVKKLRYTHVEAVGFDYGQKHAKELTYAGMSARKLNIPFQRITINLIHLGNHPLLAKSARIPSAIEDSQHVLVVPARNLIFISYAVLYALQKGLRDIYVAATLDDFRSFPDCRPEFYHHMNAAVASAYDVRVYAPFTNMTKADIVRTGMELGVPYELTWTCYVGKSKPCRVCDACVEREAAFSANGLTDPLLREG